MIQWMHHVGALVFIVILCAAHAQGGWKSWAWATAGWAIGIGQSAIWTIQAIERAGMKP